MRSSNDVNSLWCVVQKTNNSIRFKVKIPYQENYSILKISDMIIVGAGYSFGLCPIPLDHVFSSQDIPVPRYVWFLGLYYGNGPVSTNFCSYNINHLKGVHPTSFPAPVGTAIRTWPSQCQKRYRCPGDEVGVHRPFICKPFS